MRRSRKLKRGAGTPTLVAKGTCIVGEVHFSGSLEIEGQVNGNIQAAKDDAESCVRILDTGVVIGEVRAPFVIVSGRIEGDIHASKQVELASRAVVKGDIHYALLEIEKGAQVNGGFVQASEQNLAPGSAKEPVATDEVKAVGSVGDTV